MPPPPSAWEIGFIAMRDDLCSQTRVLHPLYKGLPQGFSSQSAWVKGGWSLDTKKPALVAGHLKESTQTGIRTQDQLVKSQLLYQLSYLRLDWIFFSLTCVEATSGGAQNTYRLHLGKRKLPVSLVFFIGKVTIWESTPLVHYSIRPLPTLSAHASAVLKSRH